MLFYDIKIKMFHHGCNDGLLEWFLQHGFETTRIYTRKYKRIDKCQVGLKLHVSHTLFMFHKYKHMAI